MRVIWDPSKSALNLRKHGVAFADAATVLDDPFAITADDTAHDEQRFVILGADLTGMVLVVVYAYADGDDIRLISAREANRKEKRYYANKAR